MNVKKALVFVVCVLFVVSCFAQMQMPKGKPAPRGKTELKAGDGSITIDYGRPELKGRDLLSQIPATGWRMGANQATVLSTPVDLSFGTTKVPKGNYSLWLKQTDPDKFELAFNSQTGQWGTMHDPTKDLYQVPMKKEALSSPAEMFTIDLKSAPKGGVIVLNWGSTQLSTEFQFAQ
jgi:hypothetical protein